MSDNNMGSVSAWPCKQAAAIAHQKCWLRLGLTLGIQGLLNPGLGTSGTWTQLPSTPWPLPQAEPKWTRRLWTPTWAILFPELETQGCVQALGWNLRAFVGVGGAGSRPVGEWYDSLRCQILFSIRFFAQSSCLPAVRVFLHSFFPSFLLVACALLCQALHQKLHGAIVVMATVFLKQVGPGLAGEL